MENQTEKKHFKSFWPMIIIIILSFFAGGAVMWIAFNSNLQESLNSTFPSYNAKIHNRIEKEKEQILIEQSQEKELLGAQKIQIEK